jgi:predicted nucleotidyltransferase
MTDSVRQALAEARRRLEALYGDRLVHVVLYGSQARGDARPDSDVDVLVILKEPVNVLAELKQLTPLKLGLLERYDEYITFQPFTEWEYRERRSPLMINVRREGIEL